MTDHSVTGSDISFKMCDGRVVVRDKKVTTVSNTLLW